MSVLDDEEIGAWMQGVLAVPAGSFLKAVADAACKADSDNYMLMRPFLLALRDKYPQYTPPGEPYGGSRNFNKLHIAGETHGHG